MSTPLMYDQRMPKVVAGDRQHDFAIADVLTPRLVTTKRLRDAGGM
jgi:hypothetical protein